MRRPRADRGENRRAGRNIGAPDDGLAFPPAIREPHLAPGWPSRPGTMAARPKAGLAGTGPRPWPSLRRAGPADPQRPVLSTGRPAWGDLPASAVPLASPYGASAHRAAFWKLKVD